MAQPTEPVGDRFPVLVWLEGEQAGFVREALARIGATGAVPPVHVVAIGAPPAPGAVRGKPTEFSAAFPDAMAFDDLRHACATAPVKAVLFATARGQDGAAASAGAGGGSGSTSESSPLDDAELLRSLRARGVRVLALEPAPITVLGTGGTGSAAGVADDAEGRHGATVLPVFVRGRAMMQAADVLEHFGAVRTVMVSSRCGSRHGSLASRLFDAMLIVHRFLGVAESIDASVITPASATGVHMAPPESLRGLRGDLTANLRFAGDRAASLSLSSRGGRWFRGVTLLGESGCLRLDENGFEFIEPEGRAVDSSTVVRDEHAREIDPASVVLGEQMERAIDPRAPEPPPVNTAEVLAMCEAAGLSARTGQAESPATILRMARRE